MSGTGPPSDGEPSPAAGESQPRVVDRRSANSSPRRRRLSVVAFGLVAAAVVSIVVVLLTRDDGPSHPSTWEPRLAELAAFVEEQKEATFAHPVRVVYLDEAEFKERVSIDELSDDEREEVERAEAALRALGLHGGTGSLRDQANTLSTEGTAAYYDPDEKEIVIPAGESESLAGSATLVHELTHALQDHLGQLEDLDDTEAEFALDALVEGEAEHIRTAWIESLDADDREVLGRQRAESSAEAREDLGDINPAMLAIVGAPYSLGEPMVEILDRANKLDDAFDDPPNSMADVLDPARWLDPVEMIEVEPPQLNGDEEARGDDSTFGAHVLYLMLATTLQPADALNAVSGWGGDRMRLYEAADGADCLRVDVVGVDAAATARLRDDLESWVASRPEGAASTQTVDDRVQFDACDRGTTPATLTMELASSPDLRASLVSIFVDSGANPATASCVATELIGRLPLDLLMSEDLTSDQQQQVRDTMDDARGTCLDS